MDLLLSCSIGIVGGIVYIGLSKPSPPSTATTDKDPAVSSTSAVAAEGTSTADDEIARKNKIIMEKVDQGEIEIGDFNWVKMLDWTIFSVILLALLFALNYKTHGSFLTFLERIFPREFETIYKIVGRQQRELANY